MHLGQVLKRQFFQNLTQNSFSLSLNYEQNTYDDGEDAHEHIESGKTESQHLYQPIYDEPDTQQQYAEIFRELHCSTPFCERVKSFFREAWVTLCLNINRALNNEIDTFENFICPNWRNVNNIRLFF